MSCCPWFSANNPANATSTRAHESIRLRGRWGGRQAGMCGLWCSGPHQPGLTRPRLPGRYGLCCHTDPVTAGGRTIHVPAHRPAPAAAMAVPTRTRHQLEAGPGWSCRRQGRVRMGLSCSGQRALPTGCRPGAMFGTAEPCPYPVLVAVPIVLAPLLHFAGLW